MADLQDELNSTAEAGELDRPGADEQPTGATGVEPALRPDPVPEPDAADAAGPEPEPVPEPELESEPGPEPEPGASPQQRARALLLAHPVADGYSGLPRRLRELPYYDLELGDNGVDTDVPRLRAGGVGAQFWSVHVPAELTGDRAVSATLEQLDLVKHVVAGIPEGLRLARNASETADARACGRIAVLTGPAGAAALGDSLATLRALHALGLSSVTLAGTSWAGPDGLSAFGEEVVREMNRLGVLADLSGASDATARRVLAVSKAPSLLARSGARALRDHPDNASDELLAALGAAKGLCLVPLAAEQTGTSLAQVADHLDHVRRVAGPESVGLSGVYDTGAAHADELADASRFPRLVAELIERGWPTADLALLTWGNTQRALRGADFTGRAARERREASTATIDRLDRR
ncbi:dipeptidase [Streptomyces sp. NPDC059009]|uniref:dipeptidase n=1 Tax=Streptomyces sp. NPDC059009 TaxID=3346694 RepID=UPI0036B0261C